ncbi:MAG: Zn-ribbon domain-containing OB-fold protein [Lautropia sp.]
MADSLPPKPPRPSPTALDRPYWEFLRCHELRLQRCAACMEFRFPASPICPACRSAKFGWERCSGQGEVFSWVVFHKSYFPSFNDKLPYNVAMIRLAEGPMFIADIVDLPLDRIRKGLPVEIVFDDSSIPDFTIARFRPRTRPQS